MQDSQTARHTGTLLAYPYSTNVKSLRPRRPRGPPPVVLFRVPRAPSHLRRPLRVPSFAPTLLPDPEPSPPTLFEFDSPPISFLLSPRPRSGPTPVRHLSQNPPLSTPPTHLAVQRSAAQVVFLVYAAQVLRRGRILPNSNTCLAHLSGTPKSVPPDQTYTRFLGPACSKRSSTRHLVRHFRHASYCQSLCISSS